ncbi:MAG: hypothetical protein M3332_07740, partial [Actinomycetota bacterium]|nr:hypothetical protein [Actinomycetota bacterium]
ANEIDNRPVGVPFYEVAPVVLQRINGLARAKNSSYRPVSLSGRYQEGDIRHQVVRVVDTAECREQAMPIIPLINGAPVPSPPLPGPRYAALASVDADVAEVLEIMGRPEAPNWIDLYKVYEIIEYTGQLKVAMAGAGISSNRASVFVRTACHPDAGGPDARHGRSKQDPPTNHAYRPGSRDDWRAGCCLDGLAGVIRAGSAGRNRDNPKRSCQVQVQDHRWLSRMGSITTADR